MKRHQPTIHLKADQRGATLAIVLIFLVVLTLLAVTALSTTTLEENIAGNLRDRNLAFQAAEAALRDAKMDIENMKAPGVSGDPRRSAPISGATNFGKDDTYPSCSDATSGATLGLCLPTGTLYDDAALNATTILTEKFTVAPSVAYGTFTGATALDKVASQPRYLIEAIKLRPRGDSRPNIVYRITARGYGARMESQVTLQEVYRPL